MEEIQAKTKKPIGLIVILAVLALGMLVSIGFGVYLGVRVNHLETLLSDDGTGGPTRENDVTIADEYVIRDTTQISDAYISGDSSSLSDEDRETLQMASDVLDEIITDGMTDFDREKAVYDWMCANLTTDDGTMTVIPTAGDEVDAPHGVLKNHTAVCVGYATTFRLFMQMMQIPCMVEHNTECYHSWDVVQLDGEWYITDIYSDVGSGSYAHFNVTNEMMLCSGEDFDTDFFPVADSLTYNLAYRNAVESDDVYALPAALRAALDDGDSLWSVRYAALSDDDWNAADSMLYSIQDMLYETEQFGEVYMDYNYYTLDDGGELVVVTFTRFEDDTEDDTETDGTDAQQQKIDDAVNAAFGDITMSDYSEDSYGYDTIGEAEMFAATDGAQTVTQDDGTVVTYDGGAEG